MNESVLYGLQGVCRIVDVIQQEFDHHMCEYYVLQPVFEEKSTIFVPTQNEKLTAKMRPVLSKDEVLQMIRSMPNQQPNWIEQEAERKECYREVLARGNCEELIRMAKAIYFHQKKLQENGKKLHTADEHFLKDAEKALYEEFAYVLKMERKDVLPFMIQQIKKTQQPTRQDSILLEENNQQDEK